MKAQPAVLRFVEEGFGVPPTEGEEDDERYRPAHRPAMRGSWPLAFLAFVASRPLLIGSAAYGMLVALELGGAANRLSAEPIWVDRQISGLGRLTTTGDGATAS